MHGISRVATNATPGSEFPNPNLPPLSTAYKCRDGGQKSPLNNSDAPVLIGRYDLYGHRGGMRFASVSTYLISIFSFG